MKHLLSIAFAQELSNFDEIIEFQGESIRLTQYSTNFDLDLTKALIKEHDGKVDVICISGIPPVIRYPGGTFVHPDSFRLKNMSKETPTVDGQKLKDIYIPWAMRQFVLKNSDVFLQKKISFYSGALNKSLLEVLSEFDNKILLADPYFFLKMPLILDSMKTLEKFIRFAAPLFKRLSLKRNHLSNFSRNHQKKSQIDGFFDADIFVGNETTFSLIDLEHLKGKTIVTDFLGPKLEKRLLQAQVGPVLTTMPRIIDNKVVNFPILEGLFTAFHSFDSAPLSDDAIISWIDKLSLKPTINSIEEPAKIVSQEKNKFAFIVHPLSTKMIFRHPWLGPVRNYSKQLGPTVENLSAYLPGYFYGKIKGVRSEADGTEVEGLIYMVVETPRKLMEQDPEKVYRKLGKLCIEAKRAGAKLIGLGAFTKIVGDAGVTVEKRSPIPVTTGNSLSACSTLWAAKFAVDKMNLVERVDGVYQGRVMVVGATGSIGAVSAKILATQWREIILVAPRAYKLLELKEEILQLNPLANVQVSTVASTYLNECDLVVTTTSARGEKVLPIELVKSGAVICDVSRPFDISESDALSRPDVLVIASGEVILPGDVEIKLDMGLEGNIVYACLAETALLAMEGKFESFTLSRNINFEKVMEIDRLAKKHGVRLSCIMGHNGFITDEEIALCREHAVSQLN